MQKRVVFMAFMVMFVLMLGGCQFYSTSKGSDLRSDKDHGGSDSGNQKRFVLYLQRGVVEDTQTAAIWQNSKIGHNTREIAEKKCEELVLDGHSGWRLPTTEESSEFHSIMNKQGDLPKQSFMGCVAEVTSDGYVMAKKGAQRYKSTPGHTINFRGKANFRCIYDR